MSDLVMRSFRLNGFTRSETFTMKMPPKLSWNSQSGFGKKINRYTAVAALPIYQYVGRTIHQPANTLSIQIAGYFLPAIHGVTTAYGGAHSMNPTVFDLPYVTSRSYTP